MDRIKTSFIATLFILFFRVNPMMEDNYVELFKPLTWVTDIAPDHETCIKKPAQSIYQKLYKGAQKIATLKNEIRGISFSPDSSKMIFKGRNKEIIRVFKTENGETIFETSDPLTEDNMPKFLNNNDMVVQSLPNCLIDLPTKKIIKLGPEIDTVLGFYKKSNIGLLGKEDIKNDTLLVQRSGKNILITNLHGESLFEHKMVNKGKGIMVPEEFSEITPVGDAIAWKDERAVNVLIDIGEKNCRQLGPFEHDHWISSVAFMGNDRIIVGTNKEEGAAHIWHILTGVKLLKVQVSPRLKEQVPSVRLSNWFSSGSYVPICKLLCNEESICAQDGFGRWYKADMKSIQTLIEEKKNEQNKN